MKTLDTQLNRGYLSLLSSNWLERMQPGITSNILLLEQADAIPGCPAISSSALVGSGLEASVKHATNLWSDTSSSVEFDWQKYAQQLAKSPATGLGTILQMAMNNADYNPLEPDGAGKESRFNAFLTNINQCPFLHLLSGKTHTVEMYEKNWNKVIDSVAGLFEGVSKFDISNIIEGIKNLIKALVTRNETRTRQTLLLMNAVSVNDSEILLYLYRSYVTMTVIEQKSTTKQMHMDVTAGIYQFDKENWPFLAPMVAKAVAREINGELTPLNKWQQLTTTPPAENLQKTVICI